MSKLEKLPRVRSRFLDNVCMSTHIFNKYILNQKLDMEICRCHLKGITVEPENIGLKKEQITNEIKSKFLKSQK